MTQVKARCPPVAGGIGTAIRQVPVDRITYDHVEPARHDAPLGEGLPMESYLDVGDRGDFANGGVPVWLYPDFSARMWEAHGRALLIVTGPQCDAARAWLAVAAARRRRNQPLA